MTSIGPFAVVPGIHRSGGWLRPGQHVLLILRPSPAGPVKVAHLPVPRRLWAWVAR